MGLLILTHSSRPADMKRLSLNYLTRRYEQPDRLQSVPPLNELPPAHIYEVYGGGISFFHTDKTKQKPVRLITSLALTRKIQHAHLHDNERLVVCTENGIEVWRLPMPWWKCDASHFQAYTVEKVVDHPLMAGLHTAFTSTDGKIVCSASAPDAVMLIELETCEVERIVRMPADLYGSNYCSLEDADLRSHYINNDCQTTHINCAYPGQNGEVLVSTLIQGAIGIFDRMQNWQYREVSRGFTGCHGARFTPDGLLYFADSTMGALVIMDRRGQVLRRYSTGCRWLHDVQHLWGNVYAFALSDWNQILVADIAIDRVLYRQRFRASYHPRLEPILKRLGVWVGNTTQFISFHPDPFER